MDYIGYNGTNYLLSVLNGEESQTFYGVFNGNADSADKLRVAKSIQTNLASTSSAYFNGSKDITPGVTGTLPIANGGTGATTAAKALTNFWNNSYCRREIELCRWGLLLIFKLN